jgi:hypothetical protein
MAESLDLGELERELNKYISYSRKKGIKRTLEGHLRAIRNWFKKAEEFKCEREHAGGSGPGGHVPNGVHSGAMVNDADPLIFKLTAYKRFLAANPRQAREYLEAQPQSVRKAIWEAMGK